MELQVLLPAMVRVFFPAFAVFCLRLAFVFICGSSNFACKLHVILPAEAGIFTC